LAKLVRNGRIRAVNFNLIFLKSENFWLDNGTKFAQIKKNRPQILGRNLTARLRHFKAKLNQKFQGKKVDF
jgi:hypothetical protein